MAQGVINNTTLTAIADAIREKTGETGLLLPSAMPNAIAGIKGGGIELPQYLDYTLIYNGYNEEFINGIVAANPTIHPKRMLYFMGGHYISDMPATLPEITIDVNALIVGNVFSALNLTGGSPETMMDVSNIHLQGNLRSTGMIFGDYNTRIVTIPEDWLEDVTMTNPNLTLGRRCQVLKDMTWLFKCIWRSGADSNGSTVLSKHFPSSTEGYMGWLETMRYIPQTNMYGLGTFQGNTPSNTGFGNSLAHVVFGSYDTPERYYNHFSVTLNSVGYWPSNGKPGSYYLENCEVIEINSTATYNQWKNDTNPLHCYYSKSPAWSKYTKASAVETINSLRPATADSSQAPVLQFKNMATCGSATPDGAVGDLTDAEIAVATEKGWTVTIS